MKKLENQLVNKLGVYPNMVAINSTGAATQDGSEYVAGVINNSNYGFIQALMFYPTSSGTNITALSGTPGVPNGRIEANGDSQLLESIQKGHGIGPGMASVRFINDSPTVWGDRVLKLSGQGVLVLSYPDLTNATYVGDGNNTTAFNSGKKFYKSTTADGLNPSDAGTYLILPDMNPTFLKQYLGTIGLFPLDGDFIVSVTITSITAFSRLIAIPYQTSDGAWRLRFSIELGVTSGSRIALNVFISGVTFRGGSDQAVSGSASGSGAAIRGSVVLNGTNQIIIRHESVTSDQYIVSGDVELQSKPDWADDFAYEWYITY